MAKSLFRLNRVLTLGMFGLMFLAVAGCGDDDKSTNPGDPQGYLDADGIMGGKLYDKFWATETGWNQSDPNLTSYNAKADFYRCKQCHGWDLKGSQGAYISRAANANRPNVSPLNLLTIAAGKTPQELFDALKSSTGRRSVTADLSTYDPNTNPTTGDKMPDYGSIFTDDHIWDMVKFLKEEAVDVSSLYESQTTGAYPTGSITYSNIGKDGVAANGDATYTAKCMGCHGIDGKLILVDGGNFSIGSFIRSKPYEAQHKIKFGQLGSTMGGPVTDDNELKDLYKALTNATKYPNP